MKFLLALNSIGTRTEELLSLAGKAEETGFDGLLLGDHVAMPAVVNASAPYTRDGKSPMDFDTPWPECLSAMAVLAGATQRIRIVSSVLILPMRNPVIVAKSIQTMAVMSENRIVLGVGVGWLAEEFEALNAPYAARGVRTDEAIQIIRSLGTKGEVTWKSDHYKIPRISAFPIPERPVPIYVGGESEAALRRTALLGDGYLSTLRTGASLRKRLERIMALRREFGREDVPFEFIGVPADAENVDDFAALDADGINAVAVLPWKAPYEKHEPPLDQKLEAMESYAERLIKPLA